MNRKNPDINIAAIKYARCQSREAEIATHGKPIQRTRIVQSKKLYSRRKNKATFKNEMLPLFFYFFFKISLIFGTINSMSPAPRVISI